MAETLTAERKFTGGKLAQVTLELLGEKINQIRISGDFFLYPEDALEQLEAELKGLDLSSANVESTSNLIAEILRRKGAEMLGVTPRDLATIIVDAWSQRRR